jgi:hypothetical protein
MAVVPSIIGRIGILNFLFFLVRLLPIGILKLFSLKIALILDFETLILSFSEINKVRLRQLKEGLFFLFSIIKLKTSGLSLWITPMQPPDWTFNQIYCLFIYLSSQTGRN